MALSPLNPRSVAFRDFSAHPAKTSFASKLPFLVYQSLARMISICPLLTFSSKSGMALSSAAFASYARMVPEVTQTHASPPSTPALT